MTSTGTAYYIQDPRALVYPNADGTFLPSNTASGNDLENSMARVIIATALAAALTTGEWWPLLVGAGGVLTRHLIYTENKQLRAVHVGDPDPIDNPLPYVKKGDWEEPSVPQESEFVMSARGEIDRTYAVAKRDETTPSGIYFGAEDDPQNIMAAPSGPFFTRWPRGEHLPLQCDAAGTIEEQHP